MRHPCRYRDDDVRSRAVVSRPLNVASLDIVDHRLAGRPKGRPYLSKPRSSGVVNPAPTFLVGWRALRQRVSVRR